MFGGLEQSDPTNPQQNNNQYSAPPVKQLAQTALMGAADKYKEKFGFALSIDNRPTEGITVQNIEDITNPQDLSDYIDNIEINGFNVEESPFPKPFVGTFNTTMHGTNKERFVGNLNYKNLGFSNFRDNESYYNQNGTFFNNIGTTAYAMGGLATFGFRDSFGFGAMNWKYSEYEKAREMERWMNIGSSSKSGFHEFISNNMIQMGYMAGMMGGIAVENVILNAVTGGIAGTASTAVQGANATIKTTRMLKAMDSIRKMTNAMKSRSLTQVTSNSSSWLSRTGSMYMPFGQTFKVAKNWKAMGGTNAKNVMTGITSLYGDIREFALVRNESDLESGFAFNQLLDNEIENYKAMYGELPSDEKMKELRGYAEEVRDRTKYANWAITYLANKTVLNPILSNTPTSSLFAKTLQIDKFGNRVILRNATRRDIRKGITDLSGKAITKRGQKIVEVVPNTFKSRVLTPRNLYLAPMGFMRAQFHQAIELNIQAVTSQSLVNYYADLWKGDASMGEYLSYMNKEVGNQFTTEGFGTFMSGFFMGGMHHMGAQMVSKVAPASRGLYERFTNKKVVDQKSAEYKAQVKKSLGDLETKYKNFEQYLNSPETLFDPSLINALTQTQLDKALERAKEIGDIKAIEEIESDKFFSAMNLAIETGMTKEFSEHFDELLSRSDEDLLASRPYHNRTDNMTPEQVMDAAESVRQNIREAKSKMIGISETFRVLKKEYPNPYNREGDYKEILRHHVWNQAITALAYNHNIINEATGKIKNLNDSLHKLLGFKETLTSDINILYNGTNSRERYTLKEEIKNMSVNKDNLTNEQKKDLEYKEKKLKFLDSIFEKLDVLSTTKESEPLTSKDIKQLRKDLEGYLKLVAKQNNEVLSSPQVDQALDSIIQTTEWSQDLKIAVMNIELLSQMDNFNEYVKRDAESIDIFKSGMRKFAEGWYKQIKDQATNEKHIALLEEIMEKEGIYFDPQYITDIVTNGEFLNSEVDGRKISFWEMRNEVPVEYELGGEKLKRVEQIIRKYLSEHTDVELRSDIEGRRKTTTVYNKDTVLSRKTDIEDLRKILEGNDSAPYQIFKEALVNEYLKTINEKEADKIRELSPDEYKAKVNEIIDSPEFEKFYKQIDTFTEGIQKAIYKAFNDLNSKTNRIKSPTQVQVEFTAEEAAVLNSDASSWEKAKFLMGRIKMPIHKIKDTWYFRELIASKNYTEEYINKIIEKIKNDNTDVTLSDEEYVKSITDNDPQLKKLVSDLGRIPDKLSTTGTTSPITDIAGIRMVIDTIKNSIETGGKDIFDRQLSYQLELLGFTSEDINRMSNNIARDVISRGLTKEEIFDSPNNETLEEAQAKQEEVIQTEKELIKEANEYLDNTFNEIEEKYTELVEKEIEGIVKDGKFNPEMNIHNLTEAIYGLAEHSEIGSMLSNLKQEFLRGRFKDIQSETKMKFLERIDDIVNKNLIDTTFENSLLSDSVKDFYNKRNVKAYPQNLTVMYSEGGTMTPHTVAKVSNGKIYLIPPGARTTNSGKPDMRFARKVDLNSDMVNDIVHPLIDKLSESPDAKFDEVSRESLTESRKSLLDSLNDEMINDIIENSVNRLLTGGKEIVSLNEDIQSKWEETLNNNCK